MEVCIPRVIAPECRYVLSFLAEELGFGCMDVVEWGEERVFFRAGSGALDFPMPFIRPGGDYALWMLPEYGRSFDFFGVRIPLVYGEDRLEYAEGCWRSGVDLIGTIFFFLARWEEGLHALDRYGRCDESHIWSVRAGLHTRALVNEYAWVLSELLRRLGVELEGLRVGYLLKMTHDVDGLFRYGTLASLCRALGGDVLHRRSVVEPFRTLRDYARVRRGVMRDPFDTFDLFMDLSESLGVVSEFYFIPSYSGEYDARYDIRDVRIRGIVDNILRRGHLVGVHPSRNTYGNADQFSVELARMRSLAPVERGRHHYLQVRVPDSYRVWESAGLVENSSVGFSHRAGFRSGCCSPYWLYDVAWRRPLVVREYPLCLMDGALWVSEVGYSEALLVRDEVRRYGGVFTVLWHTDAYNRWPYRAWNVKMLEVCRG